MSNITNVETIVFVTYAVEPIPATFESSLYQHLLDAVWGDMRAVDEDIRVVVHNTERGQLIREVRYQFGENYDELYADEIGKLIEKEIGVWAAKTNVYDVVAD